MSPSSNELTVNEQEELARLRATVAYLRGRDQLLTRIDEQTRDLNDAREITLRAATLLGQFLQVNRCAYADVEPDQDTFNLTGNFVEGVESIIGRYTFTQFSQACLEAMRDNRAFVVEDSETDPRVAEVRESFRATQIRSAICVPLVKNGVFTAAMAVHCKDVRSWSAEEVSLVRTVASRCWESIERTRAVRELSASEDVLNLALEAGRAGTFDWFMKSDRVTWTPELERLYGVAPGTFEGSFEHWQKRVLQEDQERITREIGEVVARKQQDYGYDFRAILPDGQLRWLHGQAHFVYDEAGDPIRMIGINVDIHDRRTAEEVMIRTEKLAAVGRLASSIAHEINNPLESVTNLLFLAGQCETMDSARRYLTTADMELRRVSTIANQTLRFHKQSTKPTLIHGEKLFSDTLVIYQGKLTNSRIDVQSRMRAAQPVLCFEGEIRQVLNNLIGNAIDAMSSRGKLFLRSREGTNWKTGHRGLILTVADTGSGMPPETLKKAFDAFFTTKGIGGTGLGLWVSQEIIARHNGTLHVRSRTKDRRSGTAFTVFLPYEAVERSHVQAV